jgi:cobalt-zinc-cadmium efflux system membrane fusion protein
VRRGVAALVLVALLGPVARADEHGHEHEEPEAVPFTVEDFARFGVRIATAGPGLVDSGVELPGEVRPNAERTAHIAAQFPGRVREVRHEPI